MDDLLYTNTFTNLNSFNFTTTNAVVDDDLKLKVFADRFQQKEIRTVLNINSNQRKLITESDLTDADEYSMYIDVDNFANFKELYNLAKEVNRNIYSYEEYVKINGDFETAIQTAGFNLPLRPATLINSLATFNAHNDVGNSLLLEIAVNVNERTNYKAMASALNAYVMSSPKYDRNKYWMPFYFTGDNLSLNPIKQLVYKDADPSSYSICLAKPLNHVKSVRLLSCELFNSINNVTEKNNIITLQLLTNNGNAANPWTPVILTAYCKFNFIMITLDVGVYTMSSLVDHLQFKINDECVKCTGKKYADSFQVKWSLETGTVIISCKRSDLLFHLKFYSELWGTGPMPDSNNSSTHGLVKRNLNRELWYMLGFPWPYQINTDNSDKYTTILTNSLNGSTHQVFKEYNSDIFDRSLPGNIYTSQVETLRPFKFPDISIKCIYLIIKGLKSFESFKPAESFTLLNDVFAKVQITDTPGEICFDSFVTNPLVFLNVIENLNLLEISWVDESGTLVDFNRVDHSFSLEIIHYVTQVDANLYNTTLGNIDKKSYPEWLLGGN